MSKRWGNPQELEKAEMLKFEAGSFAIPPQSRAKHLLLLLEGAMGSRSI
jgi:hypothetical protein